MYCTFLKFGVTVFFFFFFTVQSVIVKQLIGSLKTDALANQPVCYIYVTCVFPL